jgi:hypothetical protein
MRGILEIRTATASTSPFSVCLIMQDRNDTSHKTNISIVEASSLTSGARKLAWLQGASLINLENEMHLPQVWLRNIQLEKQNKLCINQSFLIFLINNWNILKCERCC